jgi:DNA-directed RNA polymerase subunit H (RpoH/RPB5)
MAQSTHIQSIYKSRKTILEHFIYQGYNIDDYNNFSINEIYTMYQNKQLDMLLERPFNKELKIQNKKTYVKYHLAKTLRPQNIYDYIDDLFNLEKMLSKNDDLIIIIKDEPNETILKTLQQIWEEDKLFVIVWNIKYLQFNVLKHVLVPKHIVLNKEEEIEFRKRYNVQRDNELPDISRFSPVSMAIGIRPGEVCKILRPSKTAINSDFYRICSSSII